MSGRARFAPGRWLQQTEAASLRRDGSIEAAAARRWDALGSPALRMALVREIVATRAAELTLAYRNVVSLAAGFRTRRAADGTEELHPEPCVIFMTKLKWDPGEVGEAAQRLPKALLTFGPDPTAPANSPARVCYAVPTDVQLAQRLAGARAHARASVKVSDTVSKFVLPGTLTCGVRVRDIADAESLFALSAMHVLSPVPRETNATGGAAFKAIGSTPRRGVSAPFGGHIDADLGLAFDAQLAEVRDQAWFNDAFEGLSLSAQHPYIAAPDVFADLAATRSFRIVVHDRQPNATPGPRETVLAQFSRFVGTEWQVIYDVRRNGKATPVGISHPELIVLTVHPDCAPPVSGDSGAAVLCERDDGELTLVGMYMARGPAGAEREAYVLPAWQLFDPANWRQLPVDAVELQPTFLLS
jgi:hypothetical protein